jgi:CheY-like chemotaxis protein
MVMPLTNAILVVDDDTDTRQMLVAYLQVLGFTVHSAPNGATALPMADALRPRVILIDLAMPGINGLETTRQLRANANLREATIIAVTGYAMETDRAAAHRAGCDFFIPKPYDLPTLAHFVEGLLHPRPLTAQRLSPTSDP